MGIKVKTKCYPGTSISSSNSTRTELEENITTNSRLTGYRTRTTDFNYNVTKLDSDFQNKLDLKAVLCPCISTQMVKLITETRPHFISQNSVYAYTMRIVNSMVRFGADLVLSVGDQIVDSGEDFPPTFILPRLRKWSRLLCIPRIDMEITPPIDSCSELWISYSRSVTDRISRTTWNYWPKWFIVEDERKLRFLQPLLGLNKWNQSFPLILIFV